MPAQKIERLLSGFAAGHGGFGLSFDLDYRAGVNIFWENRVGGYDIHCLMLSDNIPDL